MLKRSLPLLAVLVLGMSVAQAADTPAAVSHVGVANTARIFADMQELKDLRQKMDQERKLLEGVDREKREKLNSLKAERGTLKPDTPQFQEKNAELLRAAIEYETWGKLNQADFQRLQKTQMKGLFDKIEAATAEVAKKKGLDLVLTDQRPDFPDDLDQLNVDQLRSLITARTVLYAGDKVDISADVLAALDAKYKAAGK